MEPGSNGASGQVQGEDIRLGPQLPSKGGGSDQEGNGRPVLRKSSGVVPKASRLALLRGPDRAQRESDMRRLAAKHEKLCRLEELAERLENEQRAGEDLSCEEQLDSSDDGEKEVPRAKREILVDDRAAGNGLQWFFVGNETNLTDLFGADEGSGCDVRPDPCTCAAGSNHACPKHLVVKPAVIGKTQYHAGALNSPFKRPRPRRK